MFRTFFLFIFNFMLSVSLLGINTDGSKLWFTHYKIADACKSNRPSSICIQETSPTFDIIKHELKTGLDLLFNYNATVTEKNKKGSICAGTLKSKIISNAVSSQDIERLGNNGFIIRHNDQQGLTIIAAKTDIGVLYGTYHYLRLLQTSNKPINHLNIYEIPSYQHRLLNHWDNLNGTVERGYAGRSIWKWDELPSKISPRYKQYARANASIGINGTVLNNVNANPDILTKEYLEKVKAIAGQLRPYGISVYLSVNFSSPKMLGKLPTSDPLNPEVIEWWKKKVKQIYSLIPDFGGFLVKANSEGLPGPQDFGRTHADGANVLADALRPYGGIVMWRAFVYNPDGTDRAKQAYEEFTPLDGKFKKNVIIQVKNGPIDFQPREPFSPLFGSMKNTPLMPELQITQEYLGFSDHLVYLGILFQEFLNADTYSHGRNSTVARLTDGSVFNNSLTAIAGVANIGTDTNWCGHHFAQANWYAFGRLAWNNQLLVDKIASEWLKQTFTHDKVFIETMSRTMMESREALVNYMTPLGLHHLMGWGHHYGPEPWCEIPGARPDWLPVYYHKADKYGIGFNRSSTGSNAVAQYSEPLKSVFDNPARCPEQYLLWFHHLPWDYQMNNGRNLWTELCYKYSTGVQQAKHFKNTWDSLKEKVDEQRFIDVQKKLSIQAKEAIWWRDACLLYFQTFSEKEIPKELDKPIYNLKTLKKQKFDLKHHN